jgi:hypothetical protein
LGKKGLAIRLSDCQQPKNVKLLQRLKTICIYRPVVSIPLNIVSGGSGRFGSGGHLAKIQCGAEYQCRLDSIVRHLPDRG